MKALAIIGSVILYIVLLAAILVFWHYAAIKVRASFKSVFSRKSIDKL